MIEDFRLQERFQTVAGNDRGLATHGIDGDEQGVVVLAPTAVAREISRVEEPEDVHGKWMIRRKGVHQHLHDELGKSPLHDGDPLPQLQHLRCRELMRSVRHYRSQPGHRTDQRARPRKRQPTRRAFRGIGIQWSLAKRAPHARQVNPPPPRGRGENQTPNIELGRE